MRLHAFSGVIFASLVLPACTSDLNAPSNYELPEVVPPDPEPLMVECGTVPGAALEATFTHMVTVTGGDEEYTYEATGLPDGLVIDPDTGAITGIPTTEGTSQFVVNVVDGLGGEGTATCDLTVNPRIDVDLDAALLAEQPFCLAAGDSLLDFIIEGTGDGSPITCDHTTAGGGNGRLPAGISIDPEGCNLAGSLTAPEYGTHVFVMRGTQSGVSVYLPYCVTQDEPNFAYDVTIEHSGIMDATLVPIGRTFNPDASLSVGEVGNPLFSVLDPASCGMNACYFGFSYAINGSPFDADTFALPDRTLLYSADPGMMPIGFSHGLEIGGPVVADEFKTRPWVVNISLDYCLADNEMDCDGPGNTVDNGDGHIELGIIMVPE